MRIVRATLVAVLLAAALSFTVGAQSRGCGPTPPKPPVPPGCVDLVAQCLCDAAGERCSWAWACVPR